MDKINEVIKKAFEDLDSNGVVYETEKWQAVTPPDKMREVINRFLQMEMPETEEELGQLTQADLPWAENHFQERIGGIPTNPGYEYLNWPYYKPKEHDGKFKAEGDGRFSHTYQERFWPDTNIRGTGAMRYHFGDFGDIIQRLIEFPNTRQAYFSIWHPQDHANDGVRLPCTLGYYFLIREGTIHITYHIRSCDIFRHFKNDIYMTVRLAQYVRSQVMSSRYLKMGVMSMWIGSLHCFATEKPLLKIRGESYNF